MCEVRTDTATLTRTISRRDHRDLHHAFTPTILRTLSRRPTCDSLLQANGTSISYKWDSIDHATAQRILLF